MGREYSPPNCNLHEDPDRVTPDTGRMAFSSFILSLRPDPFFFFELSLKSELRSFSLVRAADLTERFFGAEIEGHE
jgi:hypothetical protein